MSGLWFFLVLFGLVILLVWAIKSDGKNKKQQQKRAIEDLAGESLTSLYREGENLQMEEDVFSCMNEMAQVLEAKMDELDLPKVNISSPQDVFKNMSPDMRRKMGTHVNQVFIKGANDMVALEIAAITKMAENIRRVEFYQEQKAIAIHKADVTAKTSPQILRNILRGVEELSGVYAEFAHLEGPFKELGNMLMAQTARTVLDDMQELLGRTDPKLQEAVQKLIPYERKEPEPAALNQQNVQPQVAVAGEVVDELPPHANEYVRQRANGKNSAYVTTPGD